MATSNLDPRLGAEFFLNVPAKVDDPFPDLAYLRRHQPIYFHKPLNTWFFFRYDDVARGFQDPRFTANRMAGLVDLAPEETRADLRRIAPYLETFMLMKDGTDHTRVRGHMQAALTPKVVTHLEPLIQKAADELLDPIQATGRVDVAAAYAFLLPAYVLADLFGIPTADRPKLLAWSVAFIDFFNIIPITVKTARQLIDSGFAMVDYTRQLLADRKAHPRDDFLGNLVAGQAEPGGLSEDEIIGNVMLLLLAGHVAVRNLIGNVFWLLLQYPNQFAKVLATPSLLPNAIEETLRFEPPVIMLPRVVTVDCDYEGHALKAGQMVQLSVASANRDEAHFQNPEVCDLTRPPGRTLSFGTGPHGCLGAALAREIARVAVSTALARLPNLRLDEAHPVNWYRNAANRGPINLHLRFDP